MVAAERTQADVSTAPHEDRVLLVGVPWSVYVALRDATDAHDCHVRMTYLRGNLELMSPGFLHEEAKKIIARLLELWALERDVDLRGFGNATLRSAPKERGLEPDECYKLGQLDEADMPDLAIEVIVTSALVDKMAVYAGLGVREVWEWRPSTSTIVVHRLVGESYERRGRSELLPELDLVLMATFVRPGESHTALVKAYQTALRG
jgi:Uma2 family endonuclease